MSNSPDVMAELSFLVDEKSGNLGFAPIMRGRKMVAVEFLYEWRSAVEKAARLERDKLATEAEPDNPMLVLAREAWNIVMSYPHRGELDARHRLALQSVELGIITMPEDMPVDDNFRYRLTQMTDAAERD
ncbi:hypothetical protein [Veronia nyctiphanis]|uniref:hypothetical protein n=1 Tax=Veronia nyctiphanis TaxID=1278244 RepID=UPI002E26985B